MSIEEIEEEMYDVTVDTDQEKDELSDYFRNKLYKAFKVSYPEMEEEQIEDKLDEILEEWSETTWSNSDWADYYGVDEEDLEDAMDSDNSLFD